jgi:hypothetical protein
LQDLCAIASENLFVESLRERLRIIERAHRQDELLLKQRKLKIFDRSFTWKRAGCNYREINLEGFKVSPLQFQRAGNLKVKPSIAGLEILQ